MVAFVCIGVPHRLGEAANDRSEIDLVKHSGFAADIDAPWIDIDPAFGYGIDPIVAVNIALADVIASHSDRIPIIFAADCTSCLGAMKGLNDPAVLWYDAHGDFNTPETTPSGFLGGMPLAWLVGRGDRRYIDGVELAPISESDVFLTDARDLDPMESIALRGSDVHHLLNVSDLLTTRLPEKPLYIHLDLDVLDPEDMPGSGYPAPDGPNVDAVEASMIHAVQTGQPTGILLTMWSSAYYTDPRPLANTLRLAKAFVDAVQAK